MSRLNTAVNSSDHHQGNPNASITLVEYGDFQCPYCGRAHPLVKRLLKEKGKELQFVFRNFPLQEIHPHAFVSAVSAEAAGKQGKYWEMHDLIFENQDKLDNQFLISLAGDIGLNLVQFGKDSASEGVQNKIEMDFESGIRSGVNGTPTFFLNGSPVLTYDESYESLLDAVQLEMEMKQHNKLNKQS
jgi:protein-disulfide isomerase